MSIYKWSGVLGLDVGRMSLFEFVAATAGYAESHGAKPKGGSIDEDRLAEMGIVGFN